MYVSRDAARARRELREGLCSPLAFTPSQPPKDTPPRTRARSYPLQELPISSAPALEDREAVKEEKVWVLTVCGPVDVCTTRLDFLALLLILLHSAPVHDIICHGRPAQKLFSSGPHGFPLSSMFGPCSRYQPHFSLKFCAASATSHCRRKNVWHQSLLESFVVFAKTAGPGRRQTFDAAFSRTAVEV